MADSEDTVNISTTAAAAEDDTTKTSTNENGKSTKEEAGSDTGEANEPQRDGASKSDTDEEVKSKNGAAPAGGPDDPAILMSGNLLRQGTFA